MNRSGPTDSVEYKYFMLAISVIASLGILSSLFPVVELIFSIGIPAAILLVLVSLLFRWLFDEYQLNKEINCSLDELHERMSR